MSERNASRRNKVTRSRRVPNRTLTELRINAGMAPSDLAYRAGTSAKTIRLAEAGWVPGPRIQFAVAAVFDRKPLDLWPLETQMRIAA